MRLDHIIKERYPTFVDALRDLDDALSLLCLFANLPSTESVPPKTIAKCQRLTIEFEHYLIRTHSLRKTFLSIKGIYYQATIQGQDILWLVPYKFVQQTAADVDFRIMATFVEFYTALLGFVNFRLYTGIGLVYPPKFDTKREEQGAELGAFQLEGKDGGDEVGPSEVADTEVNTKAQELANNISDNPGMEKKPEPEASVGDLRRESEIQQSAGVTLDEFSSIDPSADTLLQPSATADSSSAARLFEQFTFYLSRETPRRPLEFILKSFGCKRVGWDSLLGEVGSYCSEDDKSITHQIVDRPDLPFPSPPPTDGEDATSDEENDGPIVRKANERVPGRIYVQPQWVWDSINLGQLQRPDLYAPGATLPPHLSPWVKPQNREYDPTIPLMDQERVDEAELEDSEAEDGSDGNDEDETVSLRDGNQVRKMDDFLDDREIEQGEGMDVEFAASDEEDVDEYDEVANAANENDEWGGFSGDEADADGADPVARRAREHQAELEAEALGMPLKAPTAADVRKATKAAAQAKQSRAEREANEDVERKKMMMSRRKRKMYEKMVYSNARKDEEAEKLRAKRRKIEQSLSKQKS